MSRPPLLLFALLCSLSLFAQKQHRQLPLDTAIVSENTVRIKGKAVPYEVETGVQPVYDDNGKVTAGLHYTYYRRTDQTDPNRPLLISFNGGPGSASVWMHLAYTGPKVLNIDEEGYPVQPYGISDNPYSVLDLTDIVYVNPVNTGFSRMVEGADREQFFGVNQDIKYLADWISNWVSRHDRWRSPKFLIGESYGTTRVSGLALELQDNRWMYLNGVILVSPTEIGIERAGIVEAANQLPYFAAAAWYHKQLPTELQSMELEPLLAEVEAYTRNELLPALASGMDLSDARRREVAAAAARYSGLDAQEWLDNNLMPSAAYFWKNLLRGEEAGNYTVGRLDSRYRGVDARAAGERPDYNSELTSWLHSFTPAINYYLREELGFRTDLQYHMFGPVHPWDRSGDRTGYNLQQAMAMNPYLNVMIQSGYFDGATNYYDAKYTLWHLDPSGRMRDRLSFKGYESGHMMYLRRPDLEAANEDVRTFIRASLPGEKPARY
ncbi:carboxypeptidase C (cathepsin A) [Lewinella marina]|uniref:Carboxypeptidase n=1 Tax=Neolewinella marina TaxID=438751 RepID=A0A2G0CC74_9BACT|nr:carboxypeptidase [Neolewinella marina]NJB86733.1 carboxypeptidase C (cathepsin A) [Neolewinella marina]PHK97540.1 carboxypeptidase [Neolewinella marina]